MCFKLREVRKIFTLLLLQTLNLTEFCDKVGVPYQVISFTSKSSYSDEKDYKLFHGEIDMSDVQLNELLSSKMKKIEKARVPSIMSLVGKDKGVVWFCIQEIQEKKTNYKNLF